MATEQQPIMIGINEAASSMGLGITTIKRLVREGKLHPIKVGRRTLLHVQELQGWAEDLARQAGVPMDVFMGATAGTPDRPFIGS